MDQNELMHFGIKGMHWGIRRSPEQLGYKPKVAFFDPKKAKRIKDAKAKKVAAKAEKKAARCLKKIAKEREQTLQSSRKLLKKRYDKDMNFTQDELDKALSNFDWSRRVKDHNVKDYQDVQKYIESTAKIMGSAIDIYNNAARIANSIGKADMPLISKGENSNKDDKKDKKKDDQ